MSPAFVGHEPIVYAVFGGNFPSIPPSSEPLHAAHLRSPTPVPSKSPPPPNGGDALPMSLPATVVEWVNSPVLVQGSRFLAFVEVRSQLRRSPIIQPPPVRKAVQKCWLKLDDTNTRPAMAGDAEHRRELQSRVRCGGVCVVQ